MLKLEKTIIGDGTGIGNYIFEGNADNFLDEIRKQAVKCLDVIYNNINSGLYKEGVKSGLIDNLRDLEQMSIDCKQNFNLKELLLICNIIVDTKIFYVILNKYKKVG